MSQTIFPFLRDDKLPEHDFEDTQDHRVTVVSTAYVSINGV